MKAPGRRMGIISEFSLALTIAQLQRGSAVLTVAVRFSRSNRGEWEIYRASRWAAGYRALASAGALLLSSVGHLREGPLRELPRWPTRKHSKSLTA